MRIGILTMYYGNYSCGGLLQAYSLQQTVQELGFESEQISYDYNERFRNSTNKESYVSKIKKNFIKLLRWKFYLNMAGTRKKYKEFMRFIPHSAVCIASNFERYIDCYDKVIVGGDQVWNMDYCDNNFFLPSLDKEKKIAYSASAGKDAFDDYEIGQMVKGIDSFDKISVREISFKKLIEKYISRPVELAIDPVFLNSAEFWKKVSVRSKYKFQYIFVYLLGNSDMERNNLLNLIHKIDLPVVYVLAAGGEYASGEKGYGNYKALGVGPREFIGLIEGAEYVLTDSFHATAFSIIFERNFYCFERPNKGFSMNSRLRSLLSRLELSGRYVDLNSIREFDIENIDYDICKKRIKDWVVRSKEWLCKALHE